MNLGIFFEPNADGDSLWWESLAGGLTFTLSTALFAAIIAFFSLPRGQRAAAYAIGLTEAQTYRHVLLPMAYRIIIPPLTSETMNLIKNTAVAYSIGLTELFFRTREMGELTFRYFEAFAAATLVYVVIAMTANRVMAWVERRVAVPGYIGSGR